MSCMGLYIEITHYHIGLCTISIHATVSDHCFANNQYAEESELLQAYLGLFTKKVALQTIKICIAVRENACDLSVWEGKIEWSTVYCARSCLWNLAVLVLWFSMSRCPFPIAQKLGTQNCNFKSTMSCIAYNECVLELVCSWPRNWGDAIVKRYVCVSQLFWCREDTHNTEVAALRCEAIFCVAIFHYASAGDPTYCLLVITEQHFLCFSWIYVGQVEKDTRYNRNLAITELVVNGLHYQPFPCEQHIKENGTGNFASLKPAYLFVSELVHNAVYHCIRNDRQT